MSKLRDFTRLLGRLELEVSRANGLKFEVEGISVALSLVFFETLASIVHRTLS